MKTLQPLGVARLPNMEFIQFVRDSLTDAQTAAPALFETDVPAKNYVQSILSDIDTFEFAVKNPRKDPYTEMLRQKNGARNRAFSAFVRKVRYFEWSEEPAQKAASETLSTLVATHRNTSQLNLKAQTAATDNFIGDLEKEPYAAALKTLDMTTDRDRVKASNDDFRAAADEKRATRAEQEVTDVKILRSNLATRCRDFADYVLAMAKGNPDNANWAALLNALNVTRRRYAELLVRRRAAAASKPKTDAGTPPPDETAQ